MEGETVVEEAASDSVEAAVDSSFSTQTLEQPPTKKPRIRLGGTALVQKKIALATSRLEHATERAWELNNKAKRTVREEKTLVKENVKITNLEEELLALEKQMRFEEEKHAVALAKKQKQAAALEDESIFYMSSTGVLHLVEIRLKMEHKYVLV